MKKAYTEISQEEFKEILKEFLPNDAFIYGFEIEPKTASIKIYFISSEVPETDSNVSAPYYFVPRQPKQTKILGK